MTEIFVTNLFNCLTVTSPENNVDVNSPAFASHIINAGMPDKREFGLRVSYKLR
jgi:hypothetical protein